MNARSADLLRNAVQIAGVIDAAEAAALCEAGVDFLGFPLRLRDGREDLSETAAAHIVAALPARVTPVVITYLDRSPAIAELCERVGVRWVQLHGPIAAGEIDRLRSLLPQVCIIKSLIVRNDNRTELAREIEVHAPQVDAFITDTFDAATGRSGATGRIHDWTISRSLVATASRPVILAGGLTARNVAAAIRAVQPAAVDAHTGVERPDGRKNIDDVCRFVAAARAAFADISCARERER